MTKDHLEIRKAEISDLDNVMEIISLCTAHMISNKIFQWNDSYPSRQAFVDDINKNDLLVLLLKGEVIGCVCVSNIMDDFYKKIKWKTKSNNSLYIHRLAINPSFQGKGYAKFIMNYIEDLGKKISADSVRLDTFSLNEKNNILYTNLGYTKLGQIYFRDQSDMPFNCYEKLLK